VETAVVTYENATNEHLESVVGLLEKAGLPWKDVHEHLSSFIIGLDRHRVVAVVGLEVYGTEGLLRSLAVDPGYRDRGIGQALYEKVLRLAHERGVKRIHLLTDTAQGYFSKRGFEMGDRAAAPAGIRDTLEFTQLCPASSVYMVKDL
jgi:amino-acid N-acetyltransferase